MIANSTPRFRSDRVARPSRSTFLTTLAVLALTPLAAQALDVQFEKIAKTGDLMPGRESLSVVFNGLVLQSSYYMGEMPGVLSRPSINDSGAVVFRGTGSFAGNQNQYMTTGLYAKEPNQPLIRLVDNTTAFQVPGREGETYFADFDPPMLTNDGRVIFFGMFGGGNGFYWVRVSGGEIHKIVDSADAVPGTGTTFSYGFRYNNAGPLLYISANDAGWAVFNGRFKRSVAYYEEAGLYGVNLNDPNAHPIRLVDTTGTMGVIGDTLKVTGLSQSEGPAINNNGTVIFEGAIGSSLPGIFTVPIDGSSLPTVRALQYQTVTVSFGASRSLQTSFGGHDLNDNGDFVFQHAFGPGASDLNAVFAGNLSGVPLRSIIDGAGGYPVPGRAGASFSNIYYGPLSNGGDLGITAWDNSAGGGKGLYPVKHAGGTFSDAVAASGQVPPGRDAPAAITGFNDYSAAVNDLGNLAFSPSATADVSTALFGLYFFDKCSGQLQRVVDDTTCVAAVPVGLGDSFASSGDGFFRIWQGKFVRNGHYRSFNNSNQIAMLTAFNSSNAGIFIANITSGGPVQITFCPADVSVECPASIDPTNTGQPVASGCGTVTVTYADTTAVGCGNTSTITRTWTATNGASSATCVQTITLIDNTPPVLTCPGNLTVPCDENLEDAYAAWLASAHATDACGVPTLVHDAQSAPVACGTTTVTWTANDACGHHTSCSASFTVQDLTPPTISGVADRTVGCGPSNANDYAAWLGAVSASDACGVQALTNDAPLAPTPCATTTVTWTATDTCGLTATATARFTITGNGPPTWTVRPADLVVECDGAGNIAEIGAWLASAAATGACGAPSVSHDYTGIEPACGLTGARLVTWTAVGACGNSATTTATVTIADTTPPVFTTVPADLTLECAGAGNNAVIADWLASAVAADTCGTATIADDYAGLTEFGCGGSGSALVTWTATDACGNPATTVATLTIQDTTAPTIAAPAAVVVGVDARACSATNVALGTPVTGGGCGTVTVTNDALPPFSIGDTTVRWTATDACGRAAYATQIVTVQNLAPLAEITFQQLTDIGAEARVRLDASATSDAEHANADLTFSWKLDGVTLVSGVGLPYETYTTDMAFGEHQVTLQVTDPCGGQGEKTVTLVLDPAELSLLDIKQSVVRFCTNPPRVNITGQIGLPLGVDFSEMQPQIFARVVVAGVEVLPGSLVAFQTEGHQDQQWRYTNSAPHAPGIKLFRVNWSGNSYNYRDAGFPVELQSDLISTSETELELRNRNKRQIPGPFTLDIDGQASITLDPNFNVLASTGLTADIEVAGKRITLTLPFPLTAAAQFTFSGGLTRQFVAGDDLRAAVGHYRLNVFFDEQLLPDGVFTWPQTLVLDLAVGTQPYPGTTGLPAETLNFDQHRCLWRTTECDEVDD